MGDFFGEDEINRLMVQSIKDRYNQLENKIDLLLSKYNTDIDNVTLIAQTKQELIEMKLIIANIKKFNYPSQLPTSRQLNLLKITSHRNERYSKIINPNFPGNNTPINFNNDPNI